MTIRSCGRPGHRSRARHRRGAGRRLAPLSFPPVRVLARPRRQVTITTNTAAVLISAGFSINRRFKQGISFGFNDTWVLYDHSIAGARIAP